MRYELRGTWNEYQVANAALRSRSTRSSRLAPRAFRSGVTLIELLITIMIISILAAAVLGVAAVAGETAREAKTRTIISRIHTLLMQHFDTYTNRRVKLQPNVINGISGLSNASTSAKGRLKAEARLYALREMMLMEIPDRWSDVLLARVPGNDDSPIPLPYPVRTPLYLEIPNAASANGRTEVANLYLRLFDRIARVNNKITGARNTAGEIRANQNAECLYLVVMNACGDGESRTLFPESSIGDVDGDGAQEFLDGWGHPIQFLRWAPGFVSDLQFSAVALDNPETGTSDEAWTIAGSKAHDPFDLYRVNPRAFRLVPLIFSTGRDEEGGLITDTGETPWRLDTEPTPSLNTNFNSSPPYVIPALNPYVKPAGYLGQIANKGLATDNLTNHSIGTR